MSDIKHRYALYYNPARTHPWTLVGESKNIWWSEFRRWAYDNEEDVLKDLKLLVNMAVDEQISLGEKIRDWHPN